MTKIGLIRCEKNETRCPLTGCLTSLHNAAQGFADLAQPELIGVFTCHCPGDHIADMAKILKSKGAEVISWCTCAFARREGGAWVLGGGFCDHLDELAQRVARETGLPCILGTAHLPQGYVPQTFDAPQDHADG
ncbi:CGGC domain-containing protein [Desulfovibrio sulfodismutans]|uniref:CGGC domain-containing protein n=1 Tax=Desulfolutivibrio sulfodismutans TaxID=63561 RepID=A0A7K3NPW5_9BACT|nr:CGGC domain-containing protein [Desulfolutivibrio sulfodismutans]NDY58218.1 CGGC domain-containing protein [Desulfolutivibrio sulfodismutans]QLA12819.1 CGGC domain-containing protein [Desulfolutivibrio sulfodismutans DSM 3696]